MRHRFIVAVPVADRPQHLKACLDSLAALNRRHPAGGAISVLIADDSARPEAGERHRELATACTTQGLPGEYFGLAEQQACLERAQDAAALQGIVGRVALPHKGAARMRNLVYLHLAGRVSDDTLILFIDSDQEFIPEIDYFHRLDALFGNNPIQVLTGKVVGDPPVSPAVMAGNFLADALGFLHRARTCDLAAPCDFHTGAPPAADAAYHDLAGLFGFAEQGIFAYACDLDGPHTRNDALAHFASRLKRFFYGEHPTRKSHYQPEPEGGLGLVPARTLYTGNYCLRPAALRYFIPFAPLRLRMAGPTLGRILKAELGAGFVSANLPMLHRRTLAEGLSEFRPGVADDNAGMDLSGEYERQFYGDVMLFTVERLGLDFAAAETVFDATRAEMAARYAAMQATVDVRLAELQNLMTAHRWPLPVQENLTVFHASMRANFGSAAAGWRRVQATAAERRHAMLAALRAYAADRAAWRSALGLP